MVKAVEAGTDQKWVVLYVKRWLKAPVQMPDGRLAERDRGTPQGSAVSPGLANLVHALSVPLLAGTGVPGRGVRAVRRRRGGALCDRAPGPAGPGGAVGPDEGSRAAPAPRQDQDRLLQGQETAAGSPVHVVHLPGVHVPGQESPGQRREEHVRCVPPGDQRGRTERQRPRSPQVEDQPAHHLGPSGARGVDESGHSWLDELLREVLPDRDGRSPAAHQHLPGVLGPQEVQAARR
jgi:hypothetical protein